MEKEKRLSFEEYINVMEEQSIKANAQDCKISFEHKYRDKDFKVTVKVTKIA